MKPGVIVGILLIVLGLGAGVFGGLRARNAVRTAENVQQTGVAVPANGTPTRVNLSVKGTHGVYSPDKLNVKVTVVGPKGPVPYSRTVGESKFTIQNDTIYQFGSFEVNEPGEYTLTVTGAPNEVVVIIPLSVGGVLASVFAGLGGGCCVALIGVGVLLVSVIRGRKATSGPVPPPGPGGFPPAGGAGGGYPPAGGTPGGYPPPPGPGNPYGPN